MVSLVWDTGLAAGRGSCRFRYIRRGGYVIQKPKHYLGQTGFAKLMNERGIPGDARKVGQYYKRGLLPEPEVYIGKTPGWKKETVENWIIRYENGEVVPRRKR